MAGTATRAGAALARRWGGERVWDQSYWVWPLPPDGPLTFVVEWPAHGVPLTQARVEAAMIRRAAAQDERLWPADSADP
jgi:hypothetical protein